MRDPWDRAKPENVAAYEDGYRAAQRTGKYAGATRCLDNPFQCGTQEYDAWNEGFGYGTQDYIDGEIADD